MENKVINIISSITNISCDDLNKNFNTEKFWDSFSNVEIVIALEDEFDVSFSQQEISQFTTITKIIEILRGKLN